MVIPDDGQVLEICCMCVCVCVCVCVYIYICVCVCVCVCIINIELQKCATTDGYVITSVIMSQQDVLITTD